VSAATAPSPDGPLELAREAIESGRALALALLDGRAGAEGLPDAERVPRAAAALRDVLGDIQRLAKHGDLDGAEREPLLCGGASVAEALPAFLERVSAKSEPGWFVKELLPDEGVVVWHGRPRALKSLTRDAVVLSLALGDPYALGCPRFAIEQPVGALVVCEEDSERLGAYRFGLMLAARGVPAPEALRLAIRKGWDLESPAGQGELLATIRATAAAMTAPLRLLVIDPARASLPSIDGGPKDASKARAFLLEILRETSISTILLIHHDTKPRSDGKDERARAERASGGVTFSMADCLISFERVDDRTCMAVPSMYKLTSDPDPFRVRFESETPPGAPFRGFLRGMAETTEENAGIRERVLTYVREHPWETTGEVDRGAHLRTGEAARYLAQLEAAGSVVRITGPEARARGRASNASLWGPA
jgi:hypothetical protein